MFQGLVAFGTKLASIAKATLASDENPKPGKRKMFCNVSIWIENNNKNGGYWNTFEVASFEESVAYVRNVKTPWSIRPHDTYDGKPNPENSTWMIAKGETGRIGAQELWAIFDKLTRTESAVYHNQRLSNAVLRNNGFTIATIQDAIVWIDSYGVMIAKYGENLPRLSFVAEHGARYEIHNDSLTIHIDDESDPTLPKLCN